MPATTTTISFALVATVPTVYGIETRGNQLILCREELQQYLPFTVLKRYKGRSEGERNLEVATVPTVYGIETKEVDSGDIQIFVATVPTVYGIETTIFRACNLIVSMTTLQQYLPFTVLKPKDLVKSSMLPLAVATVPTVYGIETVEFLCLTRRQCNSRLQQYLPFTVLKLFMISEIAGNTLSPGCNSTYRLRY